MKKTSEANIGIERENKLLLTNCEKLNNFQAHNFNFKLTSPIENEVTQDFENILNQENVLQNACESDLEEVRTIIEKFKNMKAPGDNGIFKILIKKLPESSCILHSWYVYLTNVFSWHIFPTKGIMPRLYQF